MEGLLEGLGEDNIVPDGILDAREFHQLRMMLSDNGLAAGLGADQTTLDRLRAYIQADVESGEEEVDLPVDAAPEETGDPPA
jgi:hypothetical protein